MKVYDKVTLFLPITEIGRNFTVEDYLDDGSVKYDAKTGAYKSCSGTVLGMAVKQSEKGVSVTGSFPKLLYDNNYTPMTRKGAREVVSLISDALGLEIGNAFVTCLEFGTAFPMSKPPGEYIRLLGKLPYFDRLVMESGKATSLYYQQKSKGREVCFYDKTAEVTGKGGTIPFLLDNMLRYELRYNNRIGAKLGFNGVTASKLSQVAFYAKLKSELLNTYMAIKKQNMGDAEERLLTADTPKKCLEAMLSCYLSDCGAQKISEIIGKVKKRGNLSRKELMRLEQKIYSLYSAGGSGSNDNINELTEAVKNAAING